MHLARVIASVAALAASASLMTAEVSAQTYPERAISLIVPFAAGGAADTTGRIMADAMGKHLGQSIIVENVAGAGGDEVVVAPGAVEATGSQRGRAAKPDGYTVGLGHMGTHAASVGVNPKLPYDPRKDFTPIGLFASMPVALLAMDGQEVKISGYMIPIDGMGLAWVQVEPMRVIDSDLLPGKSYPSESLRFARDGRSIAVLYGGSLQVWSTSELGLRASSRRGRLAMKDFAYSPDGSRLAVWSGDENSSDLTRAQVLDPRGRALTPELLGCTRPAWTADGRRFLTLFEGDRVRDWELPQRSAPGAPPALFRVRGRSFFGDVPLDGATGRFVVADPDVSRGSHVVSACRRRGARGSSGRASGS